MRLVPVKAGGGKGDCRDEDADIDMDEKVERHAVLMKLKTKKGPKTWSKEGG